MIVTPIFSSFTTIGGLNIEAEELLQENEELIHQFDANLGVEEESVFDIAASRSGTVSITTERLIYSDAENFYDVDIDAIETVSIRKGTVSLKSLLYIGIAILGGLLVMNSGIVGLYLGLLLFFAGIGYLAYLLWRREEGLYIGAASQEIRFESGQMAQALTGAILIRQLRSERKRSVESVQADELLAKVET